MGQIILIALLLYRVATVYDSCDESLKELVDPRATKKIHNPMDLVDLAKQIQQVSPQRYSRVYS